MNKIDIDKFVVPLIEFSPQQSMKYIKALADQGLKYKDGEIVEIPQESKDEKIKHEIKTALDKAIEEEVDTWFEKQSEKKKYPFNKQRLMEIAKPETPEEKAEAEERAKKRDDNPEFVGIGELGKVWSEQSIIGRLDKIIELLQSAILLLPKEPYIPQIIYKNPLDPDPNELGGWKVT